MLARHYIRNWESIINKMKLFCLTYAGGNAAFYDNLEKQLADCIDFIKFEYSGHGKRHKEKFYSSMEELADDAYKYLSQSIVDSDEYAIIGYSMGSIGAIELLKRILQENFKLPKRVFLAAHEPHTKTELAGFDSDENEELVKERTIKFGAVPEQLISNHSFWRMYLPIYKADYSIIGKYSFENLTIETDIPATVLYSRTDTPFDEIEKWTKYFVKECQFVEFIGNHFFIQNNIEKVAGVIRDVLDK